MEDGGISGEARDMEERRDEWRREGHGRGMIGEARDMEEEG